MQPGEISEFIADVREQVLFLQDLGVDALHVEWAERRFSTVSSDKRVAESERRSAPAVPQPPVFAERFEKAPPPERLDIPKREAPAASKPAGSRLSALPSLKDRRAPKLEKSETPRRVIEEVPKKTIKHEEALIDVSPTLAETTDTVEGIRAEIGNCLRCPLHERRTQVVHTTGNFKADLMFIGEAPGADEDEQGIPFIGRAGQLLTKIIESIGLKREDVAIGNINRCRPPGNRAPTLV